MYAWSAGGDHFKITTQNTQVFYPKSEKQPLAGF